MNEGADTLGGMEEIVPIDKGLFPRVTTRIAAKIRALRGVFFTLYNEYTQQHRCTIKVENIWRQLDHPLVQGEIKALSEDEISLVNSLLEIFIQDIDMFIVLSAKTLSSAKEYSGWEVFSDIDMDFFELKHLIQESVKQCDDFTNNILLAGSNRINYIKIFPEIYKDGEVFIPVIWNLNNCYDSKGGPIITRFFSLMEEGDFITQIKQTDRLDLLLFMIRNAGIALNPSARHYFNLPFLTEKDGVHGVHLAIIFDKNIKTFEGTGIGLSDIVYETSGQFGAALVRNGLSGISEDFREITCFGLPDRNLKEQ